MNSQGLSRCAHLDSCGLWRILQVTRRLATSLDMNKVLRQIIDAALEVLDAERGTIFLYDSEREELYSEIATGSKEIRFPADQGIAGETARSRAVVNVPDCYAHPKFSQRIDRESGYVTRSMLSIPLVSIDNTLVGVLQVLNKRGGEFTPDDEHLATALAAQCAVVLQKTMLVEQYLVKQKLERDLALAKEIQMKALPKELPQPDGYEIGGWSEPADETGGDIYDAVAIDGHRVALLLGDATGHGVGPALSVTQVRAMFRMGLRLGSDLDSIFAQVNNQLTEDLPGNRFVTGFMGFLDTRLNRLVYHSGGQGPLMHYHAEQDRCEWLEASSIPMGIRAYRNGESPPPIEFSPGDLFGLITDGIFEYANSAGEQFERDRVARVIRQNRAASPAVLIETIREAISDFSGGTKQDDDMTILLVRRAR